MLLEARRSNSNHKNSMTTPMIVARKTDNSPSDVTKFHESSQFAPTKNGKHYHHGRRHRPSVSDPSTVNPNHTTAAGTTVKVPLSCDNSSQSVMDQMREVADGSRLRKTKVINHHAEPDQGLGHDHISASESQLVSKFKPRKGEGSHHWKKKSHYFNYARNHHPPRKDHDQIFMIEERNDSAEIPYTTTSSPLHHDFSEDATKLSNRDSPSSPNHLSSPRVHESIREFSASEQIQDAGHSVVSDSVMPLHQLSSSEPSDKVILNGSHSTSSSKNHVCTQESVSISFSESKVHDDSQLRGSPLQQQCIDQQVTLSDRSKKPVAFDASLSESVSKEPNDLLDDNAMVRSVSTTILSVKERSRSPDYHRRNRTFTKKNSKITKCSDVCNQEYQEDKGINHTDAGKTESATGTMNELEDKPVLYTSPSEQIDTFDDKGTLNSDDSTNCVTTNAAGAALLSILSYGTKVDEISATRSERIAEVPTQCDVINKDHSIDSSSISYLAQDHVLDRISPSFDSNIYDACSDQMARMMIGPRVEDDFSGVDANQYHVGIPSHSFAPSGLFQSSMLPGAADQNILMFSQPSPFWFGSVPMLSPYGMYPPPPLPLSVPQYAVDAPPCQSNVGASFQPTPIQYQQVTIGGTVFFTPVYGPMYERVSNVCPSHPSGFSGMNQFGISEETTSETLFTSAQRTTRVKKRSNKKRNSKKNKKSS